MAYDSNNIFAKILRGELPCISVYEDDATLAFMDIMPQADGHVLVIPKEGAETLLDLSPEAAAAAVRTTQKVARAVKQAMNAEGIFVCQLNGAAAGQTVPHCHFHIIPRAGGEAMRIHASARADDAQLRGYADAIKKALA